MTNITKNVKQLACIIALTVMSFGASASSGIFESYAVFNGTFYDLQNPTGNPDFQGFNLGNFPSGTTFTLGGQIKTFKNGADNICGGRIQYAVYPAAGSPGAFTTIVLPFDVNLGGGGDQQWTTNPGGAIAFPTIPGAYRIAVFVTDQGDNSGGCTLDPFHTSNNGGANWVANFNVCGPGAGALPVGNYAIPGCFATVQAAVTYINANGVTGTGNVQFDVAAGHTETAPNGGITITATGTATTGIIFKKVSGTVTITASGALTVGSSHDAIIEIVGGDFITIDGFTLLENAANIIGATLATNNMTEWGVALNYASTTNGCQNITIKNCTIDLNRTYTITFGIYANSTHSATAPTSGATATTVTGGNHNLVITGNTITDVNQGIVVKGPTAAADQNTGMVIGGSAPNANTITNYGTAAAVSSFNLVSGTMNGIYFRNTKGFTVSHNSITSSTAVVTGTLRAIFNQASSAAPTGTFTNTISDNTVSVQGGAAGVTVQGIIAESTNGTTTSSLVMNSNNFTTLNHTVAATGAITALSNASIHQFITINSNTFTNLTTNTTGSFTFISNSAAAQASGSKTVNGNMIVTAFNKTGAGGTVALYTDAASSTTGTTVQNNSNNFSNITLTGATTMTGWFNNDGTGSTPAKTMTGNTFSNWTCGTSAVTVLQSNFGGTSTISTNTISNITGQGNVTALSRGGSGTVAQTDIATNTISNVTSTGTGGTVVGINYAHASTLVNINNNSISTLASTGASAVTGISNSAAGTTVNIFKNTICDISGSNASSTVNGILVSTGVTVNISNNRVGDLRTPSANAANPLIGISITGGTTVNVYYNTVYLNGTSVGALFGSSALSASTTPTVTLNNNNLVNSSSTMGAAFAVAYRRSTATIGTHGATSERNNYFASTVYYDGVTPLTLAGFKTLLGAPRDANSISVNPSFLSTTCGNANFLKINTAIASQLESGATNIAGITDDFENTIRQGNPGYLVQVNGGGTAPDIGADEFDGIPSPVCIGPPAAAAISGTSPLCSGNGTTLSLSTTYTDLGITYQWQVASVAGGPYTNMGTGSTQATGSLAGTMYYICVITCTNSGLFYTTAEYTLTVNPAQAVSVTPSPASMCIGSSTPVFANSESYTVTGNMDGAQEVPLVVTPATGTVNAVYNAVTNVLTMNVAYTGLIGTVTNAHIHGPALPGVGAGIVVALPTTIVALGGTSGNLTGTVTLPAANEADLYNGLLYVNIHTTFAGGGEIRGQLAAVVNTPSAYLWTPNTNITNNTIQNPIVSPPSTTTYTIQVTGTGGCTATNTVLVNVNQLPTILSTTATPPTLCSGSNSQLNVEATTAQCQAVIITEVCGFPTGTGGTSGGGTISPATADDPIELTNISAVAVDISGWQLQITGSSPGIFIIPAGNTVASGATFVISRGSTGGAAVPGVFVPSPLTLPASSTSQGIILSASGVIKDVVAINGGTPFNPVGSGSPVVTATDWSGTIATASGTAGIRRTVVTDGNTSTDWTVASAINTINYGIINTGFTIVPCSFTYSWSPATFIAGQQTLQNPLATAVTTTTAYSVIVTDANGCTNTGNVTVTVNPLACQAATFTSPNCAGSNFTVTANTTGGGAPYNYSWDDGNAGIYPNAATVTANLPAGTYTFDCTVTDACGGTCNSIVVVIVNALPTVTVAPSTGLICNPGGSAVTLTAGGALSYAWSPTAGLTPTSGSPVSANPTATTNYVVTGTDANGCTATASSIITVSDAVTNVTANALPNPICEGSTLNLTSSASVAGYTMNGNSGQTFIDISGTGTSVGVLADDSEHNITIPSFNFNNIPYTTARVGNNGAIVFNSAFGEIDFANAPLPSTINTAGNIALMPYWDDLDVQLGATVVTETVGNLFIIQYSNHTHDAFITGDITFQVQLNLTTGAIHFVYADVIFGDVGFDAGVNATVGIQYSGTAALQYSHLTASLVDGQSITFTPLTLNYAWTGPNTFTSGLQNPSIVGVTTLASGVYNVIATSAAGCTATTSTASVVVQATPTANAGGNATVCASSPAYTLSGAAATNQSSVAWTTAGDGSFDFPATLNPIYTAGPTDITNGSVLLTLQSNAISPCATPATNNMTLTIEAVPTANAGVNAAACNSGYILSGSVGGSATGGSWSTAGDGTFTPNNTTLNATYVAGPNDVINGNVTLTLASTGSVACVAVTDDVILGISNGVPATPTAITGAPVSECPPSVTYTLGTTSAGATSYNWYPAPSTTGVNFLTANGSPSRDVEFLATTNSTWNIRVNGVNACGQSVAYAGVSVRRSTSVPFAVIGDAFACGNDVKTYSNAAVVGATSYLWTAPAGCYFDGNVLNTPPYQTAALSVSVTFPGGYTGGNIGVAAQVACFTSAFKNLTVNPNPPLASIITGITAVCVPQNGVAYSVVATPGLTYTWTAANPNATIIGNGNANITVNFANGFTNSQLQVQAVSACGISTARKINITVTGGGGTTARPTAITGQVANLCGANSVVLTSVPFNATATYNWSTNVPGAVLQSQTANTATYDFPTGWLTGTVSVTQQNTCATVSLPRTVDVKSKPSNPVITGPAAVSVNQAGVQYSIPVITPTPNLIVWSVPTGAVITNGQNTEVITVTFGANAGSGNVVVNQNNNCGNATGVKLVTISAPRVGGNGDLANAINFTVFPNPADNYVTIQYTGKQTGDAVVYILDMAGKVVMTNNTSATEGLNTQTIDVSTLAKGLYMVNVQTPDGAVQTRIAVQ